jgi:hypothetical protein
MQGGILSMFQAAGPFLVSLMVLAAITMLWLRHHSVWLIVAIAGEAAGLAFHALITVAPELVRTTPLFFSLWTLAALVFGVGFLGYAIETSQRADR